MKHTFTNDVGYKLGRRRFLGALSALLFSRPWVRGLAILLAPATAAATVASSSFNDKEIQTLQALVGDIVPADATPGAGEAGVTDYLVQLLSQYPAEVQEQFQLGLGAIDQIALQGYGRPYHALTEVERHGLIRILSTDQYLAPFWHSVRALTVLRFYSLPIGYMPLGLPGPNIEEARFRNADHPSSALLC